MSNDVLTLPVGRDRTPHEIDRDLRDVRQLVTVLGLAALPEFDFACANPFEDPYGELNGYVGPFWFMWYSTDGEMHSDHIGSNGLIFKRL